MRPKKKQGPTECLWGLRATTTQTYLKVRFWIFADLCSCALALNLKLCFVNFVMHVHSLGRPWKGQRVSSLLGPPTQQLDFVCCTCAGSRLPLLHLRQSWEMSTSMTHLAQPTGLESWIFSETSSCFQPFGCDDLRCFEWVAEFKLLWQDARPFWSFEAHSSMLGEGFPLRVAGFLMGLGLSLA